MNKNELIDSMAAEAGMTKADAGKALDAFIASVTAALKKKRRDPLGRLRNFLGFQARSNNCPQPAHRCRNQSCSKEYCKIQSRQKPAGRFELRNLSLK